MTSSRRVQTIGIMGIAAALFGGGQSASRTKFIEPIMPEFSLQERRELFRKILAENNLKA